MKEHTFELVMLMMGILVIVGVGCFAQRNNKKHLSTFFLEKFLFMFSHSFHEARWKYIELYQGEERSDQEIVNNITKRIREDMRNESPLFFNGCTIFPKDYCKKTDIEDDAVINFIEGMLPTIQSLHQEYRKKKISFEDLNTQFFSKIQEFLLSEMKKDPLLHIQKQ